MKLLFSAFCRVNNSNRDGSETRLFNFFRFLNKKKILFDIYTVTRQIDLYNDKIKFHKKLLIKDISNSQSDHILNVLFLYITRLYKILFFDYKDNNYDVFISPSDFIIDLLPGYLFKKKNPKIKMYSWCFLIKHSIKNEDGKITLRSLLYYYMQKLSFVFMKKNKFIILVLNKFDKDYLIKRNFQNVHIVNMGVDTSEMQLFSMNKKNIYDAIFVGRFHPQKGNNDLILITKKIIKYFPKFKLIVIGGGPEAYINNFKKLIKKYHLENNINYLGFIDGKVKFEYLLNSKIFICPSRYESWGATIIESLAFKTPVLAYKIDIFNEIFNEELIYAIPFSIDDMVKKLRTFLKNPYFYKNFKFTSQLSYDYIFNNEINLINEIK